MNFNIRILSSAALIVGCAAAANAVSFSFQTFGSTWTQPLATTFMVNEGAPVAQFNLAGAVTNITALSYSINVTPASPTAGTVVGAGSFTDATLGLVSFIYSGSYSTVSLNNGLALSATATYSLPTGAKLSGNISDDLFQVGTTNYEYNTLNAVPEPMTVATFALGAAGLLIRRRRK
jgi:hypothetical protein